MARSAVDVIGPAFQHMRRQLFSPFRFGQWARLAVVGLLAGEMTNGGCSGQFAPGGGGSSSDRPFPTGPIPPPSLWFAVGIGILILLAVVAVVALIYVSSRMRFVLFDSVLAGECSVRRFWARRREPAFRYFVFQILFGLSAGLAMVILLGLPLFAAYAAGLFTNPREHLLPLILGGIALFFVFLALIITLAVIQILIKDFVVPQMALDGVTVGEGWNRLWSMIKNERAGYAGYLGMKVVLAIAAALGLGFVTLIVIVILFIPVGGAGIVAVIAGRAAGLAWNPVTAAIAIVAGLLVLICLLLILSLISVPAIVFFPAYSIHFFAERYPALNTAINTPSPQA